VSAAVYPFSCPRFRSPLRLSRTGASADAPENTLAAYRLAWEQGADAIDATCGSPATGDLCLHMPRPSARGREGEAGAMTFEQARGLDAGAWKDSRFRGEKLPTHGEILALVPAGKRILIELKSARRSCPWLQRGHRKREA